MLELGLQQLWEYVTKNAHDAHLQIHDSYPGFNVTRANREATRHP